MKKVFSIFISAVVIFAVSAEVSAVDYVLDASISVSEQYNDNVFLSRSHRSGDFVTLINPSLALSKTAEEGSLALSYSPSASIYARYFDERNNISHQASFRGRYRLSPELTVGLTDSFTQSQESAVLRTVEGGGPIVSGQRLLTTNMLNADMTYRFSGLFSLQAAAIYNMVNVAGTSDGDFQTYAGRLGINYAVDEKITLRATSIFTLYDYRISGDASSMDYSLGVNWRITPTVTLDGYGGVVITRLDQEGKTVNGFSGGLSVIKRFERGLASLTYAHGVSAGLQSSTPLRSDNFTLVYTMPLTEKVDVSASAFYGIYRALGSVGTTLASNRDEYGGTINISYRLMRYLSAFISYSFVRSNARGNSDASYTNNIVMVGLRVFDQFRF